jgi:acetyl esterase/lipase
LVAMQPPTYESLQNYPQTTEEWKAFIEAKDKVAAENALKLADTLSITVEKKEINGTIVRYVTPAVVADKYANSYFIHIHGGAYILNGGDASISEALFFAHRLQIPVISIDYRMPPEHPFPIGLNDAVASYKGILQKYPNHSLFMGGSSAGGNITMATTLKLIEQDVNLPEALFLGTPGAVFEKHGDSFYTNEGLDRLLGTWDGLITEALKLYANGVDYNNPYLAPIHANLTGFPPSVLVTGTRDLLLSPTVVTHGKLRDAGVVADLMVVEGKSHADYMVAALTPESIAVFKDIDMFFTQFLENSEASNEPLSPMDQLTYQRGIEAAIWGMPAVSMEFFWDGIFQDFKMDYNDIVAMSRPAEPKHKLLTANNVTPYLSFALNLKQDGPVVVEIPAAGDKAVLYGNFVSAWQYEIAAPGPSGEDKGKGGKYLFLPPNYSKDVPKGYFVINSPSYVVTSAFRSIPINNGTAKDAYEYSKQIKIYPLSESENPPKTRFVDGSDYPLNTLPEYDFSYFEKLSNFINREPLNEYDKVMIGMLDYIGIKKGEKFNPDASTKKILSESIVAAKDIMENWMQTRALKPYYDNSGWKLGNVDPNKTNEFTYEGEDAVWIDDRAGGLFYWATYVPRVLGKGTFYLNGMKDSNGNYLLADRNYKLTVQKDIPAEQFWSVIAYDIDTKAFITSEANRPGLSSYELPGMIKNPDGSVDIYFGEKAPEGKESNWIPTGGKDFFVIFRFYGPQPEVFDKTFKLNEIEPLN